MPALAHAAEAVGEIVKSPRGSPRWSGANTML